jgi:hypothetical protein
VADIKEAAEKKEAAPKKDEAVKKEVTVKKEKTGGIVFTGTGLGLFGLSLLLVLSAVLLMVPLPFVTVAVRKWLYRNIQCTNSGKKVVFSFDGSGLALLKYWVPALLILWVSGFLFWWGIAGAAGVVVQVAAVLGSVILLIPLAWLWTAKKRYTVAHTKVQVDSVPYTLSFSGKGRTALWHALKIVFCLFVAGLPLPWAGAAALQWCLESTLIVGKDAELKPTFSGGGGSLFWYGVGTAISPFFLFLILPSMIRGVIAWLLRYTNVIGLDRTIEFEFSGKTGPLFGYVYLMLAICVIALVINYILGAAGLNQWILLGAATSLFVATVPFVKASFLRWCAQHIDILVK